MWKMKVRRALFRPYVPQPLKEEDRTQVKKEIV
jgi:hypothetical protein